MLILGTGAVLRLWSPFDIPYTYDEMSAIFRTYFDSFSELIDKGVKIDGHPAGIQVFMYYWTLLFGYSELVVKLPFVAAGLGSVWLTYRIGQMWHSSTTGTIAAAFMATLQFTVMYSQIARPYISGMFFSLLMVFYWHKVILDDKKTIIGHWVRFVFAGALCAYNHHFSLLFAAMVGISGLFFIKRNRLWWYLLSGVAMFLLYIPHLPIFFYQFAQGGVEGWLAKPDNDFIFEFLGYASHFSWIVGGLVVALVLFGLLSTRKQYFKPKFLALSLLWFFVPFLIGFFYSKYVNAVLQYSMLIFGFPFLLIALFGHFPELKFKPKIIVVASILITTSFSLVFERQHYTMFYQSPYEQVLLEHQKAQEELGGGVCSIVNLPEKVTRFYVERWGLNTNFHEYETFSSDYSFLRFLQNNQSENLYFGAHASCEPRLVSMIKNYYPYQMWKKDYYNGFAYLFSKKRTGDKVQSVFSTTMDFEEEKPRWSNGATGSWVDTISYSGTGAFSFDAEHKWGPGFNVSLSDIISNNKNYIDIELMAYFPKAVGEFLLVSEIRSNDSIVDWRSASSIDFFLPNDTCLWNKVYHSIKLSDIDLDHPNLSLKVYVANLKQQDFIIDDFSIAVRYGNPIVYGLWEELE